MWKGNSNRNQKDLQTSHYRRDESIFIAWPQDRWGKISSVLGIQAGSVLNLLHSGKSLEDCWAEEKKSKNNNTLCRETTCPGFCSHSVPGFEEKWSLPFEVFAFRKITGLICIRALACLGFSHTTDLCNANTYKLIFPSTWIGRVGGGKKKKKAKPALWTKNYEINEICCSRLPVGFSIWRMKTQACELNE